MVGPAGLEPMARSAGHPFVAGGEPPEAVVAPIRARLPVDPAPVAAELVSRELFGRLATEAMLPSVEQAAEDWRPDLVLREPCEYASAVVAGRRGIPLAQVAIPVAEGEEAAVAALGAVDARVLLTVGHRFDPALLGPVPPHVHVEHWVDQADVLASADLVVCHGGSGTVYGALAAGVPLVVVPVFADQFENARRAARAGAALVVEVPPGPGASRRAFGDAGRKSVLADPDGNEIALIEVRGA